MKIQQRKILGKPVVKIKKNAGKNLRFLILSHTWYTHFTVKAVHSRAVQDFPPFHHER